MATDASLRKAARSVTSSVLLAGLRLVTFCANTDAFMFEVVPPHCVQVTDGKEGCVLKLSLSSVELLYSERVVDGVWVTMAIDENGREELRD